MSALTWALVDEHNPLPPQCGKPSSNSERAMHCELPPEHLVNGEQWTHHYGRDRLGRWRSWQLPERSER